MYVRMPSVVPKRVRVSSAAECVEGRAHTDSQVAVVLVKSNVVERHVGRVMDGRAGRKGSKVTVKMLPQLRRTHYGVAWKNTTSKADDGSARVVSSGSLQGAAMTLLVGL